MFNAVLTVALCLQCGHAMVTGDERVAMLGNEIVASASGVDYAGTTSLMNGVVLNEGVVFAFSAFFRSSKPVRFQIWRPVENVSDSYQLIGEIRVIPAVKNAREDIYIESKLTEKCVRVQSGDRLGVYNEEAPGAVAYSFKPNNADVLIHTAKNASKVNDVIKFGSLNFPYVFSALAYIDTNISLYDSTEEFPECPKGLRIPPYGIVTLPPTSPPTGRPGATGATGPAGIQGATGANGTQGEKGDVGSTGEQGLPGATGQRGFNGSVGKTGPQGLVGLVGATGEKGDKGDVGGTGPSGPVGSRGPAGETITIPVPIAGEAVGEDNNMFSDPNFVMGLFIWLIILTILFIIILIVFIVVRRRRSDVERPKPRNTIVYSERVQSHLYENDQKWMGDMKEETETNYSNNTLKADGTENDAQRPTSFDYTNECDKQFDYVNGESVKTGMTQC